MLLLRRLFTEEYVLTLNCCCCWQWFAIVSHCLKYVVVSHSEQGIISCRRWAIGKMTNWCVKFWIRSLILFQLCWLWNSEESFGEVLWFSYRSVMPRYPSILTPADAPDSLDLQAHVLRWPAGSQRLGQRTEALATSSVYTLTHMGGLPEYLHQTIQPTGIKLWQTDGFFPFSFWVSNQSYRKMKLSILPGSFRGKHLFLPLRSEWPVLSYWGSSCQFIAGPHSHKTTPLEGKLETFSLTTLWNT